MKPKLDYYIGRPIEDVEVGEEGDWQWSVVFSGDVRISNHDKRRTAVPDDLVGMVYLMPIMGETDTRLQFGHYDLDTETRQPIPVVDRELVLTPTEYTITDERFEGGPHFPQRVDEEEEDLLPPDPSAERVVDGPEELSEATEDEE